ncbi:MAG: SDR family NAD(P)-dependent oxidoreductase, partial [Candidatus Thorarchaeota archaeon]
MEMRPKNILITGSGSGLGRAMALRLAKEGYNIILNGRTEIKLVETRNMLKKFHINALIKAGDVSDSNFVSSMISDIINEMNKLHCVINNAGIGGIGTSILDISEEDIQKVMDINFKGAWLVSKYAGKIMQTQR